METYSPIYDAVRASLRNTDIGAAVEDAIRNIGIGHEIAQLRSTLESIAYEYQRPCVIFKVEPKGQLGEDNWLYWTVKYGEVTGIGDTPSKAMYNFDQNWVKQGGNSP